MGCDDISDAQRAWLAGESGAGKRYYQPVIPSWYPTGPVTAEMLGLAAARLLGLARDCSRPRSSRVAGSFHALTLHTRVTVESIGRDPASL